MFTFSCRNCIIKKGNVTIPYKAIATRTRSKILQESTNEKEFQDFLNTIVASPQNDVSSSESSSSTSSSSSSYEWSAESPDSVVPGSTSSSSNVTDYDISDHNSIQGSSDDNITVTVPDFTQSVNTDLRVSLNLFFHSL